MPQLLLELFSEEIPARMQAQAARDLERMARERLAEQGILPSALKTFAGPRRLTLVAEDLPVAQADRTEERKGPRASAPDQAIEGFLRSTGLSRDQLVERDGVYFAVIAKTGRPTTQIIAEVVEAIVRNFPWPKSMTWGEGTLRWVRPLQRILCVFDNEVVPFAIDGVAAGDLTEGHRFMGSKAPFRARDFDQYEAGLRANFVILDAEERKARIMDGARTACFARGLEMVQDEGLLDEVCGLAEWPTPLVGDMDPAFLDLPPEVIRTSMRTHQKYFAVRKPGQDGLAPNFLVVANIEAVDGGAAVAAGNARVLSARLNDARFFWDEDRKVSLESRLEKLKGVTFHAKLGTMYQRVERIEALAREIAPLVGADPDLAAKAARLAKADLGTGMVGEFPELQGLMGGYYAKAEGMEPEVWQAVRDHYRPQGPADAVPKETVSIAVALADKLDTLVGFFAIDEKPTGSKDPYALRRAALGVIRIVVDSSTRLGLTSLVERALERHVFRNIGGLDVAETIEYFGEVVEDGESGAAISELIRGFQFLIIFQHAGLLQRFEDAVKKSPPCATSLPEGWGDLIDELAHLARMFERNRSDFSLATSAEADRLAPGAAERMRSSSTAWVAPFGQPVVTAVMAFFADRLKVLLRDQGKRHDLVDAVFALGDDDLVRIVRRVEALEHFLKGDDGKTLLAGYRRAVNILKAEEKKGALPTGEAQVRPESGPEEKRLLAQLTTIQPQLDAHLKAENYVLAMGALAGLREPVDAFFDKVLVNDPDDAVRENRLRLLSQVRDAMHRVADFSLISG